MAVFLGGDCYNVSGCSAAGYWRGYGGVSEDGGVNGPWRPQAVRAKIKIMEKRVYFMFYFHTKSADYIKYFAIAIAFGAFNSANCGELKKNFSKNTETQKNENQEKNVSVKKPKKIKIPWRNRDNCVVGGWEFKGVITDSQNESFTLRDLLGDVVIMIFSTTWCPNCPDAVRQIDSLNEKLGDLGIDNVRVMHLNMGEESQEEVRRHLDKMNVSLEAHKSVSSHLAGVSVIPSVLIVDKKGKPVCGYVGGGFDYLSDEFVKFIVELARE